MVYIDPDAYHHVADACGLGIHLGQDAAELPAAQQDIVGPAQIGMQAGGLLHGFRDCDAGDQAKAVKASAGDRAGRRTTEQ